MGCGSSKPPDVSLLVLDPIYALTHPISRPTNLIGLEVEKELVVIAEGAPVLKPPYPDRFRQFPVVSDMNI